MNKTRIVTDYKNNDFYFLYLESTSDEGITRDKWHEHSFYEIMFMVDGDNEYVIENRRYVAKKGDVLLIKPGSHHFKRTKMGKHSAVYCLGFLPEAVSNGGLAETVFDKGEHFSLSDDSPLLDILSATKKKVSKSKKNISSFIKLTAEAVILILCDLDTEQEIVPEIKNAAVQKMLNYIKENLPNITKVSDVSGATFFSEPYTRTLFKKEMGIGIMDYVRNKKVLLAHRKIRHGGKPTEIYLECGFSNYPSFYRAYVSYFGHSPREQKI